MTPTADSRRRPGAGRPPPAVIHVPHHSTAVPHDIRDQFILPPADLAREQHLMTDHFTDQLFAVPPELARTVAFPVSRLVVDPERFEDDAREPMAQKGMGVIYTRTADGRPLRRRLGEGEREDLLERFYRPHHGALTTAVEAALALHDACLVVDAHSFPTVPLPYEDDQDPRRPDVCIGTDPLHTPHWLRDAAVSLCGPMGRVAVDRPFSGALVPAASLGRDGRVLAVMIEVSRGAYMDETSGLPHAGLDPVRRALRVVIEALIDIVGTRSVVST